MTKWKQYPENFPPSSGHYAVMVRGDSERDGPHVFYDFDDYQTFATYSEGAQSFKGHHDEEGETIFAWFGPLEVPPFVARSECGEMDAIPREQQFRNSLMWAFDRLCTDGGMNAKEQSQTAQAIGDVLCGRTSPAATHKPNDWDPSAKLLG